MGAAGTQRGIIARTAEPAMGRFQHGAELYGHEDALDFSASLNPLGMPAAALDALRDNVRAFERYPDVRNARLADAVAEAEGVDAGRLCLCAGATDAFDRIVDVLAPHRVLLFDPCFSGYERALRRSDAALEHVALSVEEDFDFTERVLDESCAALRSQQAPDLVFLCTPNNPTGRAVGMPFLRCLLECAVEAGATVVLDECFAELAGLESAVPLQREFANLIVVKAFTKTYAMAGLRLGYIVCANAELAQRLNDSGAQWAVSVPAQIAGVAALDDATYLERARTTIVEQRIRLEGELSAAGMRVIPSCVNYILFCDAAACDVAEASIDTTTRSDTGHADAATLSASLFDQLLERGIIVRRCGNFEGLDDTWYRIAVRTPEENMRFIQALKEVRGR